MSIDKVSLEQLGAKVGHYTNKTTLTGCTVLLFDRPSICGVHTSGGAPGTRETDLLEPTCLVEHINAILLTGGSSFGLAAADGVMRFLDEKQVGFAVGKDKIPIVPAAVIYDRSVGKRSAPTSKQGYRACQKAAYSSPSSGNIGAGTGATVGKWSKKYAGAKGGFSVVTRKFKNINMAVAIAVNSYGNIVNPSNGATIAGATDANGKTIPFTSGTMAKKPMGNTTIGIIVTDALLTGSQAKRVAMMASDAIAKTASPSRTLYDGDTLFTVSTGRKKADINSLGIWATETAVEAIMKAVKTS